MTIHFGIAKFNTKHLLLANSMILVNCKANRSWNIQLHTVLLIDFCIKINFFVSFFLSVSQFKYLYLWKIRHNTRSLHYYNFVLLLKRASFYTYMLVNILQIHVCYIWIQLRSKRAKRNIFTGNKLTTNIRPQNLFSYIKDGDIIFHGPLLSSIMHAECSQGIKAAFISFEAVTKTCHETWYCQKVKGHSLQSYIQNYC